MSVDIRIIGIVFILLNLFFLVPALVFYVGNWPRVLAYSIWFISGAGLLFLKNWARILSFLPMTYIILLDAVFIKELLMHKRLLAEIPSRSSVRKRFK